MRSRPVALGARQCQNDRTSRRSRGSRGGRDTTCMPSIVAGPGPQLEWAYFRMPTAPPQPAQPLQSKLANTLFVKQLAGRLDGSKRTANAPHPGVIRTNLVRHVSDPDTMLATVKLKTIPQGAATQCLVATHPDLAEVSGKYFADCQVTATHPHAEDAALAERLWTRTEEIVAGLAQPVAGHGLSVAPRPAEPRCGAPRGALQCTAPFPAGCSDRRSGRRRSYWRRPVLGAWRARRRSRRSRGEARPRRDAISRMKIDPHLVDRLWRGDVSAAAHALVRLEAPGPGRADDCVGQMRQLDVGDLVLLRDRLVAEAEGPPVPDGEVY